MENKTKFYLIECYTGELLESGTDFQKIVEIPKSVAKQHNYGLMRYWFESEEKRLYIDAGPIVYYVNTNTKEDTNSLSDLFLE